MSYFPTRFTTILYLVFLPYLEAGSSLHLQTGCEQGDLKVFLLDDLLKGDEIKWLNGYLTKHKPWVLNQRDIYKERHLEMNSNTTWVSPISNEILEGTRLWRDLSTILKQLTGNEQFVCYGMFTLAYRLDFKPISKISDDDLMVQIFLNQDMRKNDYGETLFYDDDHEIMCGIHQQPGRILIWNGSINYVLKPPSMLYMQSQNSIVLRLTSSDDKYKSCMELNKANKQAIHNSKPQTFPFVNENDKLDCLQSGSINYEKHLTNKYYDSHGLEIAVFDDVLSDHDLQRLRDYLINDYHTFEFQPYDNEPREDHDNVAWISPQKADVLAQSGVWKVVKQAATFLSGLNEWYPYDVSMNIVHSFHHTRIHEDCEDYEHEYTFLLYLNKDLNENQYGETVFFERLNNGGAPGEEEYEIIAAVKPRYGRIVMFRGIIPHSARPPSPEFDGARYTFACKVSKTFGSAKLKNLRETIEALNELGLDEDNIEFSEEFEKYQDDAPDDVVNSELIRKRKTLEDLLEQSQEYFINKLS